MVRSCHELTSASVRVVDPAAVRFRHEQRSSALADRQAGSCRLLLWRHGYKRAHRSRWEAFRVTSSASPARAADGVGLWSARTAVDGEFSALTIGSHPLAESRGAEDNEGQTFTEVIAAVRSIIASVDVPVSVDLEAGYGLDPGELIQGLLDAGGVGLNIEDTVHSQGGRVRSTEEHADFVAGLRAAADAAGVPVWINGRTDLFLHAEDAASVADEAIARMQALVEAGANSVYPVRIQDDDELITAVVGVGVGAGELHGASGQARFGPLRASRRRTHHLRPLAPGRADGRHEGHGERLARLTRRDRTSSGWTITRGHRLVSPKHSVPR